MQAAKGRLTLLQVGVTLHGLSQNLTLNWSPLAAFRFRLNFCLMLSLKGCNS